MPGPGDEQQGRDHPGPCVEQQIDGGGGFGCRQDRKNGHQQQTHDAADQAQDHGRNRAGPQEPSAGCRLRKAGEAALGQDRALFSGVPQLGFGQAQPLLCGGIGEGAGGDPESGLQEAGRAQEGVG